MERLAEPDRQREMAAAMEAAKWQNIPTWKRKVLQRKEAQAMLPALKQQAIDNYWKQRAQVEREMVQVLCSVLLGISPRLPLGGGGRHESRWDSSASPQTWGPDLPILQASRGKAQ